MSFAFTDPQWHLISAELAGIGRWDAGGDRRDLEMNSDFFIQSRQRFNKGLPTPKKAQGAWLKVATAADELEKAIAALPASGAADFTMLDNHSGRIREWVELLSSVVSGAKIAADFEVARGDPLSNNADPIRDAFLRQLISAWHGYGGMVRASTDLQTGEETGPLVRFIVAIVQPVFKELAEKAPTPGVIRDAIRRHHQREH